MLSAADGPPIAAAFELGQGAAMTGPVARGVIGQVWRLETERGTWAVKEWFEQPDVAELAEGVAFQDEAVALGVPAPSTVRTPGGDWVIVVDEAPVRVQVWVDLREPDTSLDPERVGGLVGTLHRVPFEGRQPLDAWYTEPIGADRWDGLIGSPLGAMRWSRWMRSCARPVRRAPVIATCGPTTSERRRRAVSV
jgi:hypothetical protein